MLAIGYVEHAYALQNKLVFTNIAQAFEKVRLWHGFDESFGNLYHLNAEEEPEDPDYPKIPEFREKFGPRGVMMSRTSRHFDLDQGPMA
jgi:arylsulfatase A-like enzyme